MSDRNIVLIGMPAAGKSTIGILLAKAMNKDFVDTDVFIQQAENTDLQTLVDSRGLEDFCKLESDYVSKLNCKNTVIATGGSVPYSQQAMGHLRKDAIVVYLYITLEKIKQRLTNFSTRGIVIDKSESIDQLYQNRAPIYQKYADITLDTTNLNHEQTIDELIYRLAD